MLSKLLIIGRDVWRGMWQPLYPLNPNKRWWHYIEYWSFRMRDCIAALLIFLFPAGIGVLIHERYSANPKGTIAVVALLGAIWICSVLMAYYRPFTVRRRARIVDNAGICLACAAVACVTGAELSRGSRQRRRIEFV